MLTSSILKQSKEHKQKLKENLTFRSYQLLLSFKIFYKTTFAKTISGFYKSFTRQILKNTKKKLGFISFLQETTFEKYNKLLSFISLLQENFEKYKNNLSFKSLFQDNKATNFKKN